MREWYREQKKKKKMRWKSLNMNYKWPFRKISKYTSFYYKFCTRFVLLFGTTIDDAEIFNKLRPQLLNVWCFDFSAIFIWRYSLVYSLLFRYDWFLEHIYTLNAYYSCSFVLSLGLRFFCVCILISCINIICCLYYFSRYFHVIPSRSNVNNDDVVDKSHMSNSWLCIITEITKGK